jgi:hypothetical protein
LIYPDRWSGLAASAIAAYESQVFGVVGPEALGDAPVCAAERDELEQLWALGG